MAKDFKTLKENEMREIYETLLLKMGPNPTPVKSKPINAKETSSEKKPQSSQPSKDQKMQ